MMSMLLTTAFRNLQKLSIKIAKTLILLENQHLASSLQNLKVGASMISLRSKNRNTQNQPSKASWVTRLILLSIAINLTACGKARTITTSGEAPQTPSTTVPSSNPSPNTTNGSPDGNITDSNGTQANENALPPITESFTVSGASGTTPYYTTTVNTDNLLKIKITAGDAQQITDPSYGFSATYSCVSYKVTVLGSTQQTKLLAVSSQADVLAAANCPGAANHQVLDFSSRLSPGHGPITITVEAASYDFYCRGCQTYPWFYNAYPYGAYSCSLYCPSRPVYKTHTVTGNVTIQVNGTYL